MVFLCVPLEGIVFLVELKFVLRVRCVPNLASLKASRVLLGLIKTKQVVVSVNYANQVLFAFITVKIYLTNACLDIHAGMEVPQLHHNLVQPDHIVE